MIIIDRIIIRPEDYAAFCNLHNNDFPGSYELWSKSQSRYENKAAGEWKSGYDFVNVEIDASKFEAFCRRTGQPHTLKTLRWHAKEIADER